MARMLKAFTSVKTINDLKNNLLEYPIYTERSFIDNSHFKISTSWSRCHGWEYISAIYCLSSSCWH